MDVTAAVPQELLLVVFDFLPQPTLLCAARVSRRWRLAALSCSEFYRFIPLLGERLLPEDAAGLVAAWARVADECLTLGTPVGVRVDMDMIGVPGLEVSPELGAAVEEVVFQKIHDLLGQTKHLRLNLLGVGAAVVFRALAAPAPVLRSLEIYLGKGDLLPLDDNNIPLPMLANFAPNLHTLTLVNVPLNYTRAQSAFRGVRSITIYPSPYQLLASLPETFPSAVSLHVDDMHPDGDTPSLPLASRPLHLRSVRARALKRIPPAIRDLIQCLPSITVYAKFQGKLLSWEGDIAPLVAALPDPIELSIKRSTIISWELSVRTAVYPGTVRTLDAPSLLTAIFGTNRGAVRRVPWLWSDLCPLLPRLISLEIDVSALVQLGEGINTTTSSKEMFESEINLDATLGALTSLAIVLAPYSPSEAARCLGNLIAWVNSHSARGPLRCPGLARLSLSWPGALFNAPGAAPRLISQAVLVNLAKALHAPGPTELSLCGIRPLRIAAEPASEDDAFNSVFRYAGDDWVDADLENADNNEH